MKITKTHLKRIISEEIQSVRRESHVSNYIKYIGMGCAMLRENKDNPRADITKEFLRHASQNIEMSRCLRSSLIESLAADMTDYGGAGNIPVNGSMVASEEQELPPELSSIEDDEERSAAYHMWTILQALPFLQPLAVVRMIQSVLKGDWMGVIKNLPLINMWLIPEAMWELLEKGLSTLPPEMREDIVSNGAVNKLMEILFSLKEVTTASDVGEFYTALKELVATSWPAAVAIICVCSAIASYCFTYAVGSATGVGAGVMSILAALGAACPPCAGFLVGVGIGIAAICVVAAPIAVVLVPLEAIVLLSPGDEKEEAKQKFAAEVMNILNKTENEHKKAAREAEEIINQSEEIQRVSVVEDETEDIIMQPPGSWGQDGPVQPMAEGLSYDRLQALCGIDK